MNDSVLVWGGVAVLVLIAVILYCLWRLLNRRPAAPGTGGVTVDTPAETVRFGLVQPTGADEELAGVDLEGARARARAAAVRRAAHREDASASAFAEDAAAPSAITGPVADEHPAVEGWPAGDAGATSPGRGYPAHGTGVTGSPAGAFAVGVAAYDSRGVAGPPEPFVDRLDSPAAASAAGPGPGLDSLPDADQPRS